MQFKNQKKFSDLVFAIIMVFFAFTSMLVVNSIGKRQDSRSQAALSTQETDNGTAIRCPLGVYGDSRPVGYTYCNSFNPVEIRECQVNGTWKKTPCKYGCINTKKVCNSNPNPECTKGQTKCIDSQNLSFCDNDGMWSDEHEWCMTGCNPNTNDCYMCTPGTGKCVSTDKSKIQVCTEDSLWSSPKPCGTGKECKEGECVKKTWVKLTNIIVKPTKKTMSIGQSFKVDLTFVPANTTEKLIGWKSSNSSVASVDSSGNVFAKRLGKAVITVYSRPNSSIYKTVEVTVVKVGNAPTYSLSLKPTELTLGVKKSASVQPELIPNRTTEQLFWESSDENVATVYIPGCSGNYISRCLGNNYYLDGTAKKCTKCVGIRQAIIIGVKKGTATITLTASPSKAETTIRVTVK